MSETFLHRHSKPGYNEYGKILRGDNPEAPFDHTHQDQEDLTEAGKELAEKSSEEFFQRLDPKTDELFFVSSNEARAIETANIYRQKAKAKSFAIIKPEHTRSELAEKVGEGEIRVVDVLSLDTDNMLRFLVFSGSIPEVNWEAVSEEMRAKWQEARKMIDADNRGTWGSNFAAHSAEVSSILPGIETAKQLYETKFNRILKLLRWADQKAKASGHPNLKILGFGHEDYLVYFLQNELKEEGIGNCEAIRFVVEKTESGQDTISTEFRGKTIKK